eukprot:scaffold253271_cov31-Tisochrysis_lutea.AAC.5
MGATRWNEHGLSLPLYKRPRGDPLLIAQSMPESPVHVKRLIVDSIVQWHADSGLVVQGWAPRRVGVLSAIVRPYDMLTAAIIGIGAHATVVIRRGHLIPNSREERAELGCVLGPPDVPQRS